MHVETIAVDGQSPGSRLLTRGGRIFIIPVQHRRDVVLLRTDFFASRNQAAHTMPTRYYGMFRIDIFSPCGTQLN